MSKQNALKEVTGHGRIYWFVWSAFADVRTFFRFVVLINGYRKFYRYYEYDPETIRNIIENYQMVLTSRTKMMSKPTYTAEAVIGQLDDWYDERYTGTWIESEPIENAVCRKIRCSECGYTHIVAMNVPYKEWCESWKYCKECGSMMKEDCHETE